jgi:16S rRNA (uracil1498-N3)-methyltransferase
MSIPFFYISTYDQQTEIVLDEDVSKHVVSVLRMKKGEKLNLTDGLGHLLGCEIINDHKKHCTVRLLSKSFTPAPPGKVSIGISLIKNSSRFEWFLEKATEIGVNEIIPMICERTEKQKFRQERLQAILVSAMLQSQQTWLPVLSEPVRFEQLVSSAKHDQKFIAHCGPGEKRNLGDLVNGNLSSHLILIGPEGDFTENEIELSNANHFTFLLQL